MFVSGLWEEKSHGEGAEIAVGKVFVCNLDQVGEVCLKLRERWRETREREGGENRKRVEKKRERGDGGRGRKRERERERVSEYCEIIGNMLVKHSCVAEMNYQIPIASFQLQSHVICFTNQKTISK